VRENHDANELTAVIWSLTMPNPDVDALAGWDEEVPVPLDHPALPEGIRRAVLAMWRPTDNLHRVPCTMGVEWWLIDEDGELVEGFWQE